MSAGQPHRDVPGHQSGSPVGHRTRRWLAIAVTTTGVFQTELGSNAYWVSKAGIERYYAGLATELAPYGVAVNCLAPKKVVMTEGAVAGGVSVPPSMVEDPAAMGKAAVYLAGQSASTLTGTVQYSLDLLARIGVPIGPPEAEYAP